MVDSGRERIARILGEKYADCRFSTFDVGSDADSRKRAAAKNAVMAYADEIESNRRTGRNLILVGTVGTGKDHLAASVVRVILSRGMTVAFARGFALAREMQQAITGDPIAPKYIERDFLVISDIEPRGSDETTEFFHSSILDIIDGRYRENRPTIITTNKHKREDLDAAIGKRAMDRLLENALSVRMNWTSYRSGASNG